MRVPVGIYGFTGQSCAFYEETETVTVNSSGVLAAGRDSIPARAHTMEARRSWRTAPSGVFCRGQIDSTDSTQLGVFGLYPDTNIWQAHPPKGQPEKPLDHSKPPADSKPPK